MELVYQWVIVFNSLIALTEANGVEKDWFELLKFKSNCSFREMNAAINYAIDRLLHCAILLLTLLGESCVRLGNNMDFSYM